MDAHTTTDDPTRYRLSDELEAWKLKDPIERVRVHLVRHMDTGNDFFDQVQAESDQLAAELREFCQNMPQPPHDRIFSQVYAEASPVLDAQRDTFLDYTAGFAELAERTAGHSAGGEH
jgi:pyruvate dehydrogenase E1 component alpha subunit